MLVNAIYFIVGFVLAIVLCFTMYRRLYDAYEGEQEFRLSVMRQLDACNKRNNYLEKQFLVEYEENGT